MDAFQGAMQIEQFGKWQTELRIQNTFLTTVELLDRPQQFRRAHSESSSRDVPAKRPECLTLSSPSTPSHISQSGSEEERQLELEVEFQVEMDTAEPNLLGFPSAGSSQHAEGTCIPCHFFLTAPGCRARHDCNFCHLEHAHGAWRVRPSKARRKKAKELAATIVDEADNDGEKALLTLSSKEGENSYLQQVVRAKLKNSQPKRRMQCGGR